MTEENKDMQPVEAPVKSKAEQYDEDLKVFTESLETITDLDVLAKMEEETIKEQQDYENELAQKCYELPDKIEFQGTRYSRSKCYEFVVDILNTMEMNWDMAYTMYEFISYWKDAAKADLPGLTYDYYNTTLRLLGQMKYHGYEGLRKILVVNSLFAGPREEYKDDLAKTYFLAEKHNAIMTRMDAINAINQPCHETEKK